MTAKLRYDASLQAAVLSLEDPRLAKDSTFRAYLRMESAQALPYGSIVFPTTLSGLHQRYEELLEFLGEYEIELEVVGEADDEIRKVEADEAAFADFSNQATQIWNGEVDAEEFRAFSKIVSEKLPGRTLYPRQLLSAFHLAYAQHACNFSVPGAGKTTIVLAAYAFLSNLPTEDPRHVNHLLVVGPLSSFKAWRDEYRAGYGVPPKMKRLAGFTPMPARRSYLRGLTNEAASIDLTATNYETVASCEEDFERFLSMQGRRAMVVLDEAHRIKRYDGVHSSSILAIAPFAQARVVLTGTPAPNGYEDLNNLFRFLYPYKDIVGFPITALKAMSDGTMPRGVEALKANLRPFYTRIRKSDLGLSDAVPEDDIVQLSELHQEIYAGVERVLMPQLRQAGTAPSSTLVRARLMRLRQAAVNPALLLKPLEEEGLLDIDGGAFSTSEYEIAELVERFDPERDLSRLRRAIELAESTVQRQHKVVIWSYFLGNLELLKSSMSNIADFVEILTGATPVQDSGAGDFREMDDSWDPNTREAIIDRFHQPNETSVLIANPQAVGESISLHKACRTAIYFDRDFNAGRFIQSKDRIHRYNPTPLGTVSYHFLMGERTIDQTIARRLGEKEARLADLVDSEEIPLFGLLEQEEATEDIRAILYDYEQRKTI